MRARRRGLTRGPKRSVDWEGNAEFNDQFTGGSVIYALVDDQDITDHDGKLTIERVVGDLYVHNVQDNLGAPVPAWCCAGITTSDVDQGGNVTNWNAGLTSDAEGPWMWRRWWPVMNGSLLTETFPEYLALLQADAHLDVQVKRKLRDRMNLVLCISLFQFEANSLPDAALVTFQLRALCKAGESA